VLILLKLAARWLIRRVDPLFKNRRPIPGINFLTLLVYSFDEASDASNWRYA